MRLIGSERSQTAARIGIGDREVEEAAGLALSVQLAQYIVSSDRVFVSQTDMMGYKFYFVRYLYETIDERTLMASFCLRGFLPFSAGAV